MAEYVDADTRAEERGDNTDYREDDVNNEAVKALLTEAYALCRRVRAVFLVANATVFRIFEEVLQAIEDQPPFAIIGLGLATLESDIIVT